MHEPIGHGLHRHELESELKWMLRQRPSDPTKLVDFLGEVVVKLIDKNNAALARRAAEDARTDLPEQA